MIIKRISTGIENFKELIDNNYYVEKTMLIEDVLMQRINYYDNYESFYHGFMVGFLNADGYDVKSNRESADGRFDLAMLPYS
ncbi:PD-(D/E)XK nuclease domain-containing protein [Thomasclavelia sp.]|uniref:PD-(D/E)XK nuclease domain-containing protein n=1 Tax=Thomasclavelia sp. TaxID=3025757 RepID=UPI0025E9F3E8|nr:PD-(D/E)XK nuclease domain-containing protein [Thomasclavelia sp.]